MSKKDIDIQEVKKNIRKILGQKNQKYLDKEHMDRLAQNCVKDIEAGPVPVTHDETK